MLQRERATDGPLLVWCHAHADACTLHKCYEFEEWSVGAECMGMEQIKFHWSHMVPNQWRGRLRNSKPPRALIHTSLFHWRFKNSWTGWENKLREDDWLLFYMKLKFKEFPVSVLSIIITLYSSSYWGDFRMRSLKRRPVGRVNFICSDSLFGRSTDSKIIIQQDGCEHWSQFTDFTLYSEALLRRNNRKWIDGSVWWKRSPQGIWAAMGIVQHTCQPWENTVGTVCRAPQ